ncbi:MAG TPA: type II secretion system protein N [Ramlibacter sp.]|nr:type II secretion system protein N [Ramlibacter sp.]
MASTLSGGLQSRWTTRGASFALWALAALSVVYWGLKLSSSDAASLVAVAAPRAPAPPDPAAVARLLGQRTESAAAPAQASLASRFVLTGVVADPSGGGAALIAVDGRPARPFRVGATLDEGLILQSVQGRRALIGERRDGPTAVALELPALANR